MYFQHGEGPVEEHFIPAVGVRTQAQQNAALAVVEAFKHERARCIRVFTGGIPDTVRANRAQVDVGKTVQRSRRCFQPVESGGLAKQGEDALCTACVDTVAHFHQRQSVGADSSGQRRACGQTSRNGRAVVNLQPGP